MRFAEDKCRREGGHADPDDSGLCIYCAAILTPDLEDIEDAVREGRDLETLVESLEFALAVKKLAAGDRT